MEQIKSIYQIICGNIRSQFPHVKIYDYDYPLNFNDEESVRRFYKATPKDPQELETFYDGHHSSFYHKIAKTALDLVDINAKNLEKDFHVVCANNGAGFLKRAEFESPRQVELKLVGAAASGAKGASFYSGMYMDARFFQAIQNAKHVKPKTPKPNFARQNLAFMRSRKTME